LVVVLLLVGWGGLLFLLNTTLPTLGPRWLFFLFILIALTGSFLPLTAFLNYRFPSQPPASSDVIVRQALWFGVYGATLAWLQYGRVFAFPQAVILALGLAAIEWLLRWRERSLWKP
jgi:hypothetical protein